MTRIFFIEQLHLALCLLRHTGHNRYGADLFRAYTQLLRKISFHNRAEHLLRRLCRGEVLYKMRELALNKTDPSRTARGKHRALLKLPCRKALHKLVSLLHNRKVGGKCRVEYIVNADLFQRVHNFSYCSLLRRQSDLLAPCHAHRRRHLCNDNRFFILDGFPHLLCIVASFQRPHRTVGDALPAEGAVRFLNGSMPCHIHGGP